MPIHQYGITIDGEFVVICERRLAITPWHTRLGMWARMWMRTKKFLRLPGRRN